MQWLAKYQDGTEIRQYEKGSVTFTNDLYKDNLKLFRISEGTGDFALNLNCESGKLKFNNLDVTKLSQLSDGESFKFVFDKSANSFKLDKDSFDFLDNLLIKREDNYFYMEFNDRGIINVCGRTFQAGYLLNNIEIPFFDNPPYNDFSVKVNGFTDVYYNSAIPVKEVEGTSLYTLSLNKTYIKDDLKIDVKYDIVYDLIKWQSYIKVYLKSNKTINGKLYTICNGKKETNHVGLFAGSTVTFNQFMVVV